MKTSWKLYSFLREKKIGVYIEEIGYRTWYFSREDPKRMIYQITITNEKTNKKTSYEFWQSIHKSFHPNEKVPNISEVLYCTYIEPSSFQDFCDNFGYSTDSIEAKKIYEKVQEVSYNLENTINKKNCLRINKILQDY